MKQINDREQSIILLVIFSMLLIGTVFFTQAQGMSMDDQEKKKKFKDEYLDDLSGSLEEMNDWGIDLGFNFQTDRSIGFKYVDLDYQDIFEQGYDKNFGVKIYKVYDESPAYQAGLQYGDIVMFFENDTVYNSKDLEQKIENYNGAGQLHLTYFRDRKIYKTLLQLEKISDDDHDFYSEFSKKPKKYKVGIFGFYWSPSFVFNDYEAANNLLADMQFSNNQIDQLWFNEFGFKFYIGKNRFLGMVFSGADAQGTTTLTLNNAGNPVTRKMNFYQGIWGVTYDKRYRPLKKTMFSSGFFLGRGKSILTLQQQNGQLDWDELWSKDNHLANNDYLKLKKRELVFEPRVSVMQRIVGPVWLKLEAGYMLGYSGKHWRNITTDDDYVISDAPKTSLFQGFTFTIAPWIGF